MQMIIVMKWCLGLCAIALLAGLLAVPCCAGEVDEYLTKDGKFKEAVTVRIGGKDFLAAPDEVWIIKPSGDWVWESTNCKGKLSAKQVAALAQHLATQDFDSLPTRQGYEPKGPASGYQYVVIAFGKKEATFNIKRGESRADYLPKPGDPKAAAWSRFIALELVLADMLQMSEVRAEYSVWTVLKPVKVLSAGGATFRKLPDGSFLTGGKNPSSDTYTITANTDMTDITAVRLEVLPDSTLVNGGPGRADNGNFCLTAFRVTAAPRQKPTKAVSVIFQRAIADYSQPGFKVAGLSGANPKSSWSVHPMFGKKHGAVFEAKTPFGFPQGTILTFTLEQGGGHVQHTIGRWRLSVTTVQPPVPLELLELSAKELAKVWADLAATDAATAERAIETLSLSRQTVVFLKGRLNPEVPKGDLGRVAKLIKELDHDQFAVRERATKELEKLGPMAAPALAQVVLESPSLEAQRRAAKLLEKVQHSPTLLQEQRAVEVMVRMGTSDARQLLEHLAKGPPEAWLTQEAKAGLKRLGK
jgi:hypothetical protein